MITEKNKYNVMTYSKVAILNLLGIGNYLNIKIKDHYPPTGDQVVAFPRFVSNSNNLPALSHERGCFVKSEKTIKTIGIYNTNVG